MAFRLPVSNDHMRSKLDHQNQEETDLEVKLQGYRLAKISEAFPQSGPRAYLSPQVRKPYLNPKGIVSSSPGLRAASYPGKSAR